MKAAAENYLAKDTINKYIKKSNWRNLVFSPAITIFAFLSQVMS